MCQADCVQPNHFGHSDTARHAMKFKALNDLSEKRQGNLHQSNRAIIEHLRNAADRARDEKGRDRSRPS